jgi:hypothetical protein
MQSIPQTPDFFEKRPDALSKIGATTDQKKTSAFRKICYGATADSLVKYIRLSEGRKALNVINFFNAIIVAIKGNVLRL